MNNAGGALNFNATLNLNEWRRNVDQMRRDILGLNQSTQQNTAQMDSAFRNLSVGIASYFSVTAVKHFINELITVRGEFQQMENAIETITGSTSVMNNLMDEWKELTLRSPFRLSEIGQAGKQLLAYGIEVGKVTHDIEMLGNVAAGVSAPIGDIAYVYGTLKTQGRAYTRDILQFTMRGIPIMGELAKVMGVNVSELKALIEAGKVGFPEVEKAMNALTSEGGKFNNLIGKQATTLTGSVNRLKHEFELMLNDIGKANEGILKGGIDVITYLVEHYEQVNKALLSLIETYGAYRAALIVTGIAQSGIATPAIIQGFANLIRILRGATVAQEALNAASLKNPYVLLATIIAALIAVAFNYRQELGELLGIIEEQTAAQKMQEEVMNEYHLNFAKGVSQTKASINELINIIRNESSTMEMRKTAYEKLIKIDKTFIGVIDGQYRATTRLGDALQYVTTKIDAFAMAQAKASASRKILEESFEEQFKRDALKVQVENAEAEAKKWRKLADDAEKSGKASLEYLRNAYSAEKQRDKLLDQLEKQRKVANDKTSVSNAIIRSNNKEIDQKTKVLNQLREEVRLGKDNGEILALKKKQIESLEYELSGFKPQVLKTDEIDKSVEGWAERIKAQIDALETEAQKAPNQQAYLKIQARIKALNELLHPKQESQRQWAEVLPEGSIKELQRRVQLYTDAIETAVNGQVRLRRLDKYGQDKDKKGNPYYTGEVISTEEAGKRLAEINEQINDRQYKTLQERVEGAKQQWSNYSKVVEFYGKKIADEQYKDLFNGSQNYLQYLEKEINLIEQKQDAGGILSKEDKSNLIFLRNELNLLNGIEDPFETFKRSIDDAIKKLPSLADQLDFLQKAEESAFEQAGGNTDEFLKKKVYFSELTRNALQQQKDSYSQFLVEKESFESRKLAIEKKYDYIRSELNKNKDLSDPERTRLTGEANKNQAKEISEMSLELFQKTDLWVKAFGDLSKIGPITLEKMRKGFKDFLSTTAAKSLTPEQLKVIQDAYTNLDNTITNRDPFKAIGVSIERYIQKRKELNEVVKKSGKGSDEYQQKLDETNNSFGEIISSASNASKVMIGYATEMANAFGGVADDMKETVNNIQNLANGLTDAIVGYTKNDYGQMMSGIIQSFMSITNIIGGDLNKDRSIRQWQRAIEDLKNSYQDLQRTIEKTAGSASLTQQRDLIANLKQQQQQLNKIRDTEFNKKGSDKDKIASYTQQINDINRQIEDLASNFKESVTTIEFKDLSKKLADSLVEAFSQGEDAANSFEKVVDDVMRSAVANALRIQILEPEVQKMVDKLYNSMGFGKGDTSNIENDIKKYENEIADIEAKIKASGNFQEVKAMQGYKMQLQQKINELKEQLARSEVDGNFDGLTASERDEIKAIGTEAMKKYTEALKQYQDLFGQSAENAQGLKGDIKGITEKTAGALEGQINAMRIMQAEALKRSKESFDVLRNQLLVQTQIEMNTRPLKGIYDSLKSIDSKIKPGLAGIP